MSAGKGVEWAERYISRKSYETVYTFSESNLLGGNCTLWREISF